MPGPQPETIMLEGSPRKDWTTRSNKSGGTAVK